MDPDDENYVGSLDFVKTETIRIKEAVAAFSKALEERLIEKAKEGVYGWWWPENDIASIEHNIFRTISERWHSYKSYKPIDIGAYSMFLWNKFRKVKK